MLFEVDVLCGEPSGSEYGGSQSMLNRSLGSLAICAGT